MKNLSHKSCRWTPNTHFRFNNDFFPEILQFIQQCWKTEHKQTGQTPHQGGNNPDTHSQYSIIAFRRQRWLRERTSMLRYTYIAYLVTSTFRNADIPDWTRSCVLLTPTNKVFQ